MNRPPFSARWLVQLETTHACIEQQYSWLHWFSLLGMEDHFPWSVTSTRNHAFPWIVGWRRSTAWVIMWQYSSTSIQTWPAPTFCRLRACQYDILCHTCQLFLKWWFAVLIFLTMMFFFQMAEAKHPPQNYFCLRKVLIESKLKYVRYVYCKISNCHKLL